jgi:8-oxo-dGTP pyrophosphatase MutT (NUDIX family)
MSYEDTVIKECLEETGLRLDARQLIFLVKTHTKHVDAVRHCSNHALRGVYAGLHAGNIADLHIEQDMGEGFEAWSRDALLHLSDTDRNRFIPALVSEASLRMLEQARHRLAGKVQQACNQHANHPRQG